jgi:hypothetical protein
MTQTPTNHEHCDQICADHSGRGEQMRALDKQFKLLLWGIGGMSAAILSLNGVMYNKLTTLEASIISGRIDDAKFDLRIQNLERAVNKLERSQHTVP